MASVTMVVNNALRALGASKLVASVFDDESDIADHCRDLWPILRDNILRAHPWNFGVFEAILPHLAPPPRRLWTYQFALPTVPYCLKVLSAGEDGREPYEVGAYRQGTNEISVIRAHSTPLVIEYIGRVDDTERWDGMAVKLLQDCFQAELTQAVTGIVNKEQLNWQKVLSDWMEARLADGTEGTPKQMRLPRTLIHARRGAGGPVRSLRGPF